MNLPSIFAIMSDKDGKIKTYNGVIWKQYYGTKPRLRTYKSYKTAEKQMKRYEEEYKAAAKSVAEYGKPSYRSTAELVDPGKLFIVEYKPVVAEK